MVLLLSTLAILLLTGLAWAMGFHGNPVLDEQAACAEAEGRIAGFRAASAALADGGRGAIVRGLDGRLAILLPIGDRWVSRVVPPGAARRSSDGSVEIILGEPLLRFARLPMSAPPAWLDRTLA